MAWHAGSSASACCATRRDVPDTRLVTGGATGANPQLVKLMGVTGTVALVLMAVHFAWALVVLIRGRDDEKATFHRFSLAVWTIWLIPYIAGAGSSMA